MATKILTNVQKILDPPLDVTGDFSTVITCSQRIFVKNCFYDQHAAIFLLWWIIPFLAKIGQTVFRIKSACYEHTIYKNSTFRIKFDSPSAVFCTTQHSCYVHLYIYISKIGNCIAKCISNNATLRQNNKKM